MFYFVLFTYYLACVYGQSTQSTYYTCSNGDIKLENRVVSYNITYGNTYYNYSVSGRLEYYYNGQWGTICSSSFTSTNAMVACRQIGYSSGSYDYSSCYYSSSGCGNFSQCIWLNDISCYGNELTLSSCSKNYSNTCSHYNDVIITCYTNFTFNNATCGDYSLIYHNGNSNSNCTISSSSSSSSPSNNTSYKWVYILITLALLCGLCYYIYKRYFKKPQPQIVNGYVLNNMNTGQPQQQIQAVPFTGPTNNYNFPNSNAYYLQQFQPYPPQKYQPPIINYSLQQQQQQQQQANQQQFNIPSKYNDVERGRLAKDMISFGDDDPDESYIK